MSRLGKHSKKSTVTSKKFAETAVENFMGGTSYTLNPIDTLRIVASSSIFGEPSYYRSNEEGTCYLRDINKMSESVLAELCGDSKTTNDLFVKAIRNALDFDFAKTVEFAVELRNEYNMRLNPSVIFIEASVHENRKAFNESNEGRFRKIGKEIINRPDDMKNMLDYYMYLTGDKKGLPSVVKRVWADKLNTLNAYQASKYKSKGLIDLVRISHPKKTTVLNELMTTGDVKVSNDNSTWEKMKSEGKGWKEILGTIKIGHMALLRNLRGIFKDVNDIEFCKETLEKLKGGVTKGRQFPFRYYSAFKAVESEVINHKPLILDALEECIDLAMVNFPKLEGKVMSLCDNSGSAHGSFTSEFGSVTVSDIANLSAVMTGYNADEGYIGVFGDDLVVEPVSKRNGILTQHKQANKVGRDVGMATENGIWLFWKDAINNKEHFDHVFIYSDMQAGHGGLYGTNPQEYKDYSYNNSKYRPHIDVLKLVEEYRRKVNPKVNVYSVQVAGYNNSVLPENYYRTAVLSGWTGKEVLYASKLNELWDSVDNK